MFAVYLVLITLLMCTFSIYLYLVQDDKVDNSIISPFALLNLGDEAEIFEYYEGDVVLETVCYYGGLDITEIKKKLVANIGSKEMMKNFLVKDAEGEVENFYRVSKKGNIIEIDRQVKKYFELEPVDVRKASEKNSFPVKVEWKYEKEYKINLETDC